MLPSALLLRTPSERLIVSAVLLPFTPGSHIRVSSMRNRDNTATYFVHNSTYSLGSHTVLHV